MRILIKKYIIILFFIYFIFSSILIINNDYSISPLMPLLPFLYLICFMLVFYKKPSAFNSFVVVIFFAITFIRLIVVPSIYVSSGYVSNIKTSSGTDNLNLAILLVSLELMCITFMFLVNKKINRIKKVDNNISSNYSFLKNRKIVKLIIGFLLVIFFVCILSNRQVLSVISTVFDRFISTGEGNVSRRVALLQLEENSSIIFNLFSQTIYYLQIIIPAALLSYIISTRNNENVKGKKNKGLYLSLLVSTTSLLVVTDSNIDSVCILLSCLIVIYSTYEAAMKKLLPILMILVGGFIIVFLFAKTGMFQSGDLELSQISSLFSAYFSSLPNISCAFDIIYDNKLATIFGDIVAGIPYMMAFFRGYPQSVTLFNYTAYGYSGVVDQIMPLISYGYQYFSVFAPILTICIYNIALYFECKYRKSNIVFNKILYSLMFINLSIGPCIFGFPNTLKRLCMYIPLLILIRLNKKH